MNQQATETRAITKSVTVDAQREAAFRVFTEGFGTWWPVKQFSMGMERTEEGILEPRPDGRVYERQTGGEEVEWGRVVVFEPPSRLVLTWGLNGSEIDVRFHAEGERTRVDLEHRGWERLEDHQQRNQYDAGWDVILESYVGTAAT
jgi:uncharacterized protein YndB with AHSA1/START domain